MALNFLRASRKLRQQMSLVTISPFPSPIRNPIPLSPQGQGISTYLCQPPLMGSSWYPRYILNGVCHRALSLSHFSSYSHEKEQDKGKLWSKVREGSDRVAASSSMNDVASSWIDVYLPSSVKSYALLARLDKPIGTWLLAWPCMWSITMAATPGGLPDLKMLMLFGCGAVLLRGAGCTVNDLLDRDIDKKIERTKCRPVASGNLTPFQGFSFLGFQLLLGLGILLQLNNYSRVLGASSLLLVFSYPLMKRVTFWPQAYLGLTFNWGALLGWAAVKESLDPTIVLPLYASGVCWTLVYDTIYAHQDKEDDLKVGVKSTALRFGESTKKWVTGFAIASVCNLAISGHNADLAWPYYLSLIASAGQLGWQISTVDLSNRADCNSKNQRFWSIGLLGILLLLMLWNSWVICHKLDIPPKTKLFTACS